MKKTKIEWCDSTWNPVTGCLYGCEYCYARKIANRFKGGWNPIDYCDTYEGNPLYEVMEIGTPYPFGFFPTFHHHRLGIPATQKKPRNIFVCSMADLFGEWVPDKWIEEVFRACEAAPQHRYLFLTKNPKRLCDLANNGVLPDCHNYWYGSTVTRRSDKRYGGRIFDNTFISIEPLLEPLGAGIGSFGGAEWIIIGAESGNRKDKVIPKREWIENIVEAASITQAAVFMKNSLAPIWGEPLIQQFPWEVSP